MAENEAGSKKIKVPAQSEEQLKKQQQQQKILIVIAVLAAAAVLLILYRNGVLGGGSSKKPVEQYLEAIADCDFEGYVTSMPPRIEAEYRSELADSGFTPEEYMRELYSDYFTEFGDDMSVSLEFTGRKRIDAVYLDNFKQSYAEMYGEEISIRSSFEIDVTATFSGSVSTDEIELMCYAVKTGGKWYIAGCEYKTEEVEGGEGQDA